MRAALLLVVAITAPGIGALPQAQEKLIAVVPDGIELAGPPMTGPDGKKVSDVSRIVFRPDGGQVAYVGFKGGRSCPVIGTTVGETFDYLSAPVFGGDHVFFRAGNRTSPTTEKWWIHADGKKTGEEDWIGAIACNADGSQLAYWVQPGAKIEASGIYSRPNLVLVVGKKRGAEVAGRGVAHSSRVQPGWNARRDGGDEGQQVVGAHRRREGRGDAAATRTVSSPASRGGPTVRRSRSRPSRIRRRGGRRSAPECASRTKFVDRQRQGGSSARSTTARGPRSSRPTGSALPTRC